MTSNGVLALLRTIYDALSQTLSPELRFPLSASATRVCTVEVHLKSTDLMGHGELVVSEALQHNVKRLL